jgi:aryl-alcohol dehydrogenase-like predicted oxidoreductase
MRLETRRLGTSDLSITRVGFGAWAVGGGDWAFGWGPQDDGDSIRAIRHAVDLGVNWVDTASVYGHGHSEEVVGRALGEIPARDRPYVFTKCGLVWDPKDRLAPARRVSRPDVLRHDCEASLRRLGVERIDLFQIHWPDESGVPAEESWGEMARLVSEGKVRAIGASNYDVALLERCERIRHVDSVQPPFSLLARASANEIIPWAAAHGTGVLCYSPMASGILTDSFSARRVAAMAFEDWRRTAPNFVEPALSRNVALRDALKPIAGRHGATVSAVAIAWVLAWPGVTSAIVGARRPEQVDGWLPGGTLKLTRDDQERIAAAVQATGAGSGPVRPAAPVA